MEGQELESSLYLILLDAEFRSPTSICSICSICICWMVVSPCWYPHVTRCSSCKVSARHPNMGIPSTRSLRLPGHHCQAQPFAPTASGATAATDWRDGRRGRHVGLTGGARCVWVHVRAKTAGTKKKNGKRTDGMMVVDLDEARKRKD